MHSISIKYSAELAENEVLHRFWNVIGNFRESGQINGREHQPYMHEGQISAMLWTFTDEALDEKYHTHYVKTAIAQLEAFCGEKLDIKYEGHTEDERQNSCQCTQHDYFVLYYYGDFSPIRCGSCEKFVPLFKIPKLHDDRIWDILGWLSAYKACLQLDLNCGTGEKWAIKQMSDVHSGLSKQGRKVAAKLTAVSGVKTYYFLSNVARRKKAIDINRPCPNCNGEWHLATEKFGYFRHQCHQCLLMSSYSNYAL